MNIRSAVLNDLNAVAAVESECFPAAEAATKAEFTDRIAHYGNNYPPAKPGVFHMRAKP